VSEDVARAMAVGARRRARSDLAVAVTGIAGPGGGTETKPVGLVFIGLATAREVRVERFHFPGGRRQIKRWSSQAALNMVRLELLKELSSSDASVSGD
jgi:nicotinamide-nucleotide amidase